MRWIGLSLVALATALAPAASAQQQPAADVGVEGEVLTLERDRHDRFLVPVQIDGEGPFNFLIDTGAQATIVSRELADRLGIDGRTPATLVGMASSRRIEVAPLPNFALGSRMFGVMTAPLVDQANIGTAEGVLGVDSLQDQRVLFDFEKRTIEIADADTLGGNRGFEIVVRARQKLGQLIITEASLGGIPVALILGTGSESSVANSALYDRLRARNLGESIMTDINGVKEAGDVKLAKDLRIGTARVSPIPVMFVDSPSFAALGLQDEPAILLGMAELRLFRRVAIDFKQRRVLFDLPKNAGWFNPTPGVQVAY